MFKLAPTFGIAIDPPNLLVLQARLAAVAQSLILRSTRLGRSHLPLLCDGCGPGYRLRHSQTDTAAFVRGRNGAIAFLSGGWTTIATTTSVTSIELHRRYSMDVAVGIAFWFGAPINRKQRLKLESELIYRWRSPFNKECWQWWGQPFGKWKLFCTKHQFSLFVGDCRWLISHHSTSQIVGCRESLAQFCYLNFERCNGFS